MPPKKAKKGRGRKKGKKGGGKTKAPINWSDDAHFDENRAMIYIIHTTECPIFLEKALEFQSFLMAQYPKKIFQLILNDDGKTKPEDGAFEISFSQNARTERVELWSGKDKGPPRREKFPKSYDLLLPEVDKILKKIYVEQKSERESNVPFIDTDDESETRQEAGAGHVIQDVTEGETAT
ncbi:unnamed protein product [Hermetia illucens]|uniref:Selenoprotein H n=1 Tax=Hermetia illucens TaxID=343691 RepID=A0A7R8YWF1_HERIL|nr:selenoprotein H-like [Hermetia illucens]CAD7086746.1 unnamed protein product [Hermetia illucens]